MNAVFLTGRLSNDPELRFTANGKKVVNFGLAVEYRGSDNVDFFDIVAWERTAEVIAQHLTKGRRVAIRGYLDKTPWVTAEGEKRSRVEIVAQEVEFLDFPRRTEQPDESPTEEQ